MSETTIPADALAGLLDDWCGPAFCYDARGQVIALYTGGKHDVSKVRLDCLRPEVQDHVGRVLAAGVRCEACGGRGSVRASVQPGCDGECPEPCGCDAGWTRKPSPIHHILDAARPGALSNQHIAEAVAWSVRNVARGGEVLRGVYGPWEWCQLDYGAWCRMALVDSTCRPGYGGARSLVHDLRHDFPGTAETRAQKDIETLAANIAYIDGGALVLPGEQS